MNKKLIAVAVAGALGVPASMALAQTSTVQIGGSMTFFYYSHNPNNPAPFPALTFFVPTVTVAGVTTSSTVVVPAVAGGKRTDIMEPSEPEMFIRGEENLGGGLSAWFQCTSSLDGMIGGGNANGICGRNSGVGFKGSWGNLFMGNWDTPQKLVFNQARGWFGGTNSLTGGSARILNTLGGGAPSGVNNNQNQASFFRRQAQSWNYHSPSWNGFSIQAAYSASNESTGIPEAAGLRPRMWSLAGNYANGPLYLGAAYERHNDYNPLSQILGFAYPVTGVAPIAVQTSLVTGLITNITSTTGCNVTWATTAGAPCYNGGSDDNWTLVAGYKFGTVSVRGMYSRTEYDLLAGLSMRHRGWALYGDWAIQGPHTLRAQYAKARDLSFSGALAGIAAGTVLPGGVAPDTGADMWSIFYSYAFSKRTEGSIGYYRMENDRNTNMYTIGKVGATAGGKQTSAGIVLKHRF